MAGRKKATVHQPSRSNQEFVDGRRNTAYVPQAKRVKVDDGKLRHERPVDQLSSSQEKEREMILEAMKGARGPARGKRHPDGKKTIALDIDGVMANFNKAMSPYGTEVAKGEDSPSEYNYVRAGWFKNFDDFEKAHVTVMDDAGSIPLNDETAPKAVRMLKDAGFHVIALTARRKEWRGGTMEFFDRHGIDIQDEELIFADMSVKADVAHYDYILDDAPKNIIDTFVNSDSEPVVYGQRYNRHLDNVGNMKRVQSVLDFAQYVIDKEGYQV